MRLILTWCHVSGSTRIKKREAKSRCEASGRQAFSEQKIGLVNLLKSGINPWFPSVHPKRPLGQQTKVLEKGGRETTFRETLMLLALLSTAKYADVSSRISPTHLLLLLNRT
jgi:hypothetical protein